jgi:acetoin utilization deacetylase AcuC-like enzyme
MTNPIRVFYSKKMDAVSGCRVSPSAAKPGIVAKALEGSDLPVEFCEPVPLRQEEIAAAHDPEYVRGILSCRVANGFGNCSEDVARSLPYTNGAIVDAAVAALAGLPAAAALASGFHHAGYAGSGGFCTFNGLVIAALRCLQIGAGRVAIIDADCHYGNGTQDILDHLRMNEAIFHYSFGRDFYCPAQAKAYLRRIERLGRELEAFKPEVIIYQAGADAHCDDPLGGILTTEQLMERDEKVFQIARDLGVGIAWTLAGGYRKDPDGGIPRVVEIHLNTFRAAAQVNQRDSHRCPMTWDTGDYPSPELIILRKSARSL